MAARRSVCVAIICLAAALGSTSCGTQTTLETSWHIPSLPGQTFGKLAVIGLLKNSTDSKAFEIGAASRFEQAGVNAVPGFSILEGETSLSQDEMERRVEASGVDGVLFFKMIAVDSTKRYISPTKYLVPGAPHPYWWDDPYWGYYNPYPYHYWGYWSPAMQVVTTSGYWEKHATYQVETALYRTSDNKLVWTAISNTYDPQGDYDLASSLSRVALKRLEEGGFIQGSPKK